MFDSVKNAAKSAKDKLKKEENEAEAEAENKEEVEIFDELKSIPQASFEQILKAR